MDYWDSNQGLKELKDCPIMGVLGSLICWILDSMLKEDPLLEMLKLLVTTT